MKWMIASDLHGSYFYASQMQQAFEREQADRLLLLGDLLYHGPATTCRRLCAQAGHAFAQRHEGPPALRARQL